MFRSHILVCGGTGCTSGNSMKVYDALVDRVQKAGLENEVHVTKTGCFGLCAYGPIMIVYPEGAFYSQVNGRGRRKYQSAQRHQFLQKAASSRAQELRRDQP